MTQPRYIPKHKEQAKAEKGCMFTLDLNYKFTKCGNSGVQNTVQGVASEEQLKYLRLAFFILNGFTPEKAKELVGL